MKTTPRPFFRWIFVKKVIRSMSFLFSHIFNQNFLVYTYFALVACLCTVIDDAICYALLDAFRPYFSTIGFAGNTGQHSADELCATAYSVAYQSTLTLVYLLLMCALHLKVDNGFVYNRHI